MYCYQCGKQVNREHLFCSYCGTKILKEHRATHPQENVLQPVIPPSASQQADWYDKENDTTHPLILTAGILMFVWAGFYGLFNFISFIYNFFVYFEPVDVIWIGWDFVVTAAYIVIGIGIIKSKHWGYSWGIGSNILNAILSLFYLLSELSFDLLFIVLEIAIVIMLFLSRDYFLEE